MTILIKNKYTLQIDEFKFRCCIGKKGTTKHKKEGDKRTPKGTFKIENLYFRKDRKIKPSTLLKCVEIKSNMGWCDDIRFPKKYNKLIKIKKKIKHEKLRRKDNKYDFLIPIKYNFEKLHLPDGQKTGRSTTDPWTTGRLDQTGYLLTSGPS